MCTAHKSLPMASKAPGSVLGVSGTPQQACRRGTHGQAPTGSATKIPGMPLACNEKHALHSPQKSLDRHGPPRATAALDVDARLGLQAALTPELAG